MRIIKDKILDACKHLHFLEISTNWYVVSDHDNKVLFKFYKSNEVYAIELFKAFIFGGNSEEHYCDCKYDATATMEGFGETEYIDCQYSRCYIPGEIFEIRK